MCPPTAGRSSTSRRRRTSCSTGRLGHGPASEGCNLNAITPETEDSTWYFWAFARRFQREDEALSKKLVEQVAGIFEQDRVAIEGVHETMKRNRGRPVIHLIADKGQNLARRMVQVVAEKEAANR